MIAQTPHAGDEQDAYHALAAGRCIVSRHTMMLLLGAVAAMDGYEVRAG